MDHRVVIATYLQKMREFGKKAAMVKKTAFYSEVAEETGYAEETVKKIVLDQFKNHGTVS